MRSSQEVYTQLATTLQTFHPTLHWRRLNNWIWIIVGLVQARSVHLSKLALYIPGLAQEAGRVARIRRWLANDAIHSRTLYTPLIQRVLQHWRGRDVTIMLDGCFIRHKHLQMLRLSLSHCLRAVPLVWDVVMSKGNVEASVGAPLLQAAAQLLTGTRRVTFVADRGFRGREWAKLCAAHEWRYLIRVANTTVITFRDGRQRTIDRLGIRPGERRYLPDIRLTQDGDWACHLAITSGEPAELCAVMTNWYPNAWVLRHYLRRMHIEQSFRDEKSGSFDLHHSHLRDPQRLDHLLLAIAVAVLWMYELGERVLREDRRADIDPGYRRHLSVFQLGWRAFQRAMACATIPPCTLEIHPFRLPPIDRGAKYASRPVPEQRRIRLPNAAKGMC